MSEDRSTAPAVRGSGHLPYRHGPDSRRTAMRTIIRCPSCFTYVYDDAQGRATAAASGSASARSSAGAPGSSSPSACAPTRSAAASTSSRRSEPGSGARRRPPSARKPCARFLRAWLVGDDAGVASSLATTDGVCKGEILKLRALYPTVLPATDVVRIEVGRAAWDETHSAEQGQESPICVYTRRARLSASCEPTKSSHHRDVLDPSRGKDRWSTRTGSLFGNGLPSRAQAGRG